MKFKHHVVIIENDNTIHYITCVDNKSHYAKWEDGKPAMSLTKTVAEDVHFGLIVNGYTSAILKVPTTYELCN